LRHIYSANGDIVKTVETKDGQTVLGSHQDVEPYLKQNAEARNAGNNGFTASRSMRKVADVPLNVVLMWMRADGINYFQLPREEKNAWLLRKVRDNPFFATVDGGF
jgi:hypothetical protein